MRLSLRESWRLRAIERELCRSQPDLAGMLAVFASIHAGEAVGLHDQAGRPDDGVVVERGQAGGLCAGARRRLGRIVRALFVTPAEAVGLTQPMRSPGR
jgi:hypothetical protein